MGNADAHLCITMHATYVSGYMIVCHGKALDITKGKAKTCCKQKEVLKSKTRMEITIKKRRQPKDESVLKQKLCF